MFESMADLFQKLYDKRARLFAQLSDPAAVGIWKMVVDKYSDQAHFLYELLQNADDAGATDVRIYLNESGLEFIHNGTVAFSVTDVDEEDCGGEVGHLNAITSIGASAKSGENTIGKFGVGFKSVFQYTDLPHIEDDGFCFRIENYIVPIKERPWKSSRRKGETLIAFPFRNPEKAFVEVLDKLRRLVHPLLFLRSLCSIEWFISGEADGFYKIEKSAFTSFSSMEYEFVREQSLCGGLEKVSCFHFFSRRCGGGLKYSVAYPASESGELVVVGESEGIAFCYFPTRERTDLKFLLHAPFLLTDSREGIKRGEAWNEQMLSQLAGLSADALEGLAMLKTDQGAPVLDDNLFALVPIDEGRYFQSEKGRRVPLSLFSVFHGKFVDKLSSAPLFKTASGYVDARHTRYASESALVDLLDSAKSQSLLPLMGGAKSAWTFRTLRPADQAYAYLVKHHMIASEVTLGALLSVGCQGFLQAQELDFLKRWYAYFASKAEAWSVEEARIRMPVLCADGQFRMAFGEDGKPLVFLTSGASEVFASVHSELLADASCRRFFTLLGLSHPDLLSEVEYIILPKYQSNTVSADDWQTLFRDMNLIVDAYQQFHFTDGRKERFLSLFRDLRLFPSTDNRGVFALRKASVLYAELPDLKVFLSAYPEAAFLDGRLAREGIPPEKRDAYYQFVSSVGVSFCWRLKRVERSPVSSDYERLCLRPKSLRRYDNGRQWLEDSEIEGFPSFLENITEERSAAFFRLLSAQVERQSSYMLLLSLRGSYRYVEKSKKSDTVEVVSRTTAWHSLFSESWLFDAYGCRRPASQFGSALDLSSTYKISTPDVLFFLGIPDDSSLRGLDAEQRRAVKLVSSFAQEGVAIDRLEKLLEDLRLGKLPKDFTSYFEQKG